MKKKVISLLLTAAMAGGLVACGNGSTNSTSAGGNEQSSAMQSVADVANSADLRDEANIDNSVERESITVAWKAATTLEPWGTNNDIPGNYEVYEMLYEVTAEGERYGILAVEMESAALYLHAAAAHVQALAIFTVSDDLWRNEHCTAEERQSSFNDMIKIALETIIQ